MIHSEAVYRMHEKFKMRHTDIPYSLSEKKFRSICLQEELTEFIDAHDKAEELDALVDLIVFAIGTVERMGISNIDFNTAFDRVMVANLKKQPGPNEKRGFFPIDLVKPDGWQAPDLSDLV